MIFDLKLKNQKCEQQKLNKNFMCLNEAGLILSVENLN
jgi:hypothetical protein